MEFTNSTEPHEYGGDEVRLVSMLSDEHLSLIVFPLSFWLFSFIFMGFEKAGILQQYRLRTPAATKKLNNRVAPWHCVVNVLGNQTLELLAGLLAMRMLGPSPLSGLWEASPAWVARAALRLLPIAGLDVDRLAGVLALASPQAMGDRLEVWARNVAIPATQLLVAFLVADTWLYFAHRFFHTNQFFYRTVHSWHHRLYAPYTFGAQYIHPAEALLLDSIGNILSLSASCLSPRLSIAFSIFGAYNFIVDHCGYVFPFGVLPTECDTLFHDIHHQPWGLKSNFSVYFTFWDRLFGTLWTDRDAALERYARSRTSNERKSVPE